MKRRVPLSPIQSAAFAMGRGLIIFETWYRQTDAALDVDRAILLDFAVQHPRSVRSLVPDVDAVVRAHGLQKNDLSDLFAQRHFGTIRERFLVVVSDLVARDLLVELPVAPNSDLVGMKPTESGFEIARRFSSPLSLALRAVCSVLCDAWRKRNVRDLANDIRKAIPDESQLAANLAEPFAPWLIEAE